MSAPAKKQPHPFVKGRITPRQIKGIHATIHKLGMDDDTYRAMLQGRYGVRSCKDLTWSQAEELLASLNGTAPPSQPSPAGGRSSFPSPSGGGTGRGLKYADLDNRPGFARPGQLRLIDAMFHQVTRAEGEEAIEKALNSFVNRICHVAGIRMVKGWQVEKIVKALEAMGAVKKEATP